MMSESQAAVSGRGFGPSGIGGWLVLPMLGLFLSPVRALTLLRDYEGLSGVVFSFLSFPQAAFIIIAIGLDVFMMVVFPIALLVMLFRRRKNFPILFISWAIAGIALQIIGMAVAGLLFREVFEQSEEPFFDDETVSEFVRNLFTAVVWAPYMAVSRRVRNTFVE